MIILARFWFFTCASPRIQAKTFIFVLCSAYQTSNILILRTFNQCSGMLIITGRFTQSCLTFITLEIGCIIFNVKFKIEILKSDKQKTDNLYKQKANVITRILPVEKVQLLFPLLYLLQWTSLGCNHSLHRHIHGASKDYRLC